MDSLDVAVSRRVDVKMDRWGKITTFDVRQFCLCKQPDLSFTDLEPNVYGKSAWC